MLASSLLVRHRAAGTQQMFAELQLNILLWMRCACNSWTSKPIVRTSSLPSTLPKQKSLYLAVSHSFLSQTFPECLLWARFCSRWWIRHNTSSQPGLLFKWRRLITLSNWQIYPNTKGSIFNTNSPRKMHQEPVLHRIRSFRNCTEVLRWSRRLMVKLCPVVFLSWNTCVAVQNSSPAQVLFWEEYPILLKGIRPVVDSQVKWVSVLGRTQTRFLYFYKRIMCSLLSVDLLRFRSPYQQLMPTMPVLHLTEFSYEAHTSPKLSWD